MNFSEIFYTNYHPDSFVHCVNLSMATGKSVILFAWTRDSYQICNLERGAALVAQGPIL